MPQRKRTKNTKWQKVGAAAVTVGQFLLDRLLELGEFFPEPLETKYRHARRLQGRPQEILPCRIRQELKRMRDRGWIVEAEKQGKKFLKLTKKGRLQALYKKIQTLDRKQKKLWDGKWRLAIFDIPEKGRHERNLIRKTLKTAGFHQLQKSVYIYPHEIPGETIAYLKTAGLLPFIRFARIDRMDDIEDLKKWFRLEKRK